MELVRAFRASADNWEVVPEKKKTLPENETESGTVVTKPALVTFGTLDSK